VTNIFIISSKDSTLYPGINNVTIIDVTAYYTFTKPSKPSNCNKYLFDYKNNLKRTAYKENQNMNNYIWKNLTPENQKKVGMNNSKHIIIPKKSKNNNMISFIKNIYNGNCYINNDKTLKKFGYLYTKDPEKGGVYLDYHNVQFTDYKHTLFCIALENEKYIDKKKTCTNPLNSRIGSQYNKEIFYPNEKRYFNSFINVEYTTNQFNEDVLLNKTQSSGSKLMTYTSARKNIDGVVDLQELKFTGDKKISHQEILLTIDYEPKTKINLPIMYNSKFKYKGTIYNNFVDYYIDGKIFGHILILDQFKDYHVLSKHVRNQYHYHKVTGIDYDISEYVITDHYLDMSSIVDNKTGNLIYKLGEYIKYNNNPTYMFININDWKTHIKLYKQKQKTKNLDIDNEITKEIIKMKIDNKDVFSTTTAADDENIKDFLTNVWTPTLFKSIYIYAYNISVGANRLDNAIRNPKQPWHKFLYYQGAGESYGRNEMFGNTDKAPRYASYQSLELYLSILKKILITKNK